MSDKVKKVVRILSDTARLLELVISVVVLAAIIMQFSALPVLFRTYVLGNDSMHEFHIFLDNILTMAIGLEFFRMLCFSDADAVLEVVLFVLARHMLSSGSTALDNLLTVIGIGIVVLLNILLKVYRKRMEKMKPDDEA